MGKTNKLTVTILTLCISLTSILFAANGAWTFDGDGNWKNAANWAGGIVPDGSGDIAYFTNIYTDTKLIVVPSNDVNITVGGIYLNATRVTLPNRSNIYSGINYPGATNITLDAGGGTPIINVNSNRLDIQCILEGTDGFTLQGQSDGVLMIVATPKPISGPVLLQDVFEIIYNDLNNLMNADVTISNTTVRTRHGGLTSKSLNICTNGILNLTEITEEKVTGNPINVNIGARLQLSSPATMTGSNIVVNNGGEFVIATAIDGTSTLENDMSIAGNGIYAALGAFHTEGGNVTNNGDVYFAADSRFAQWGGGTNYLVQNGGFSGPGSVELLVQGGHETHARTFYLNGPDSRTGNTMLSALASHGTFEIGNVQQFPNSNLTLNVYHWSSDLSLTYDLNSYSQEVSVLTINPGIGNDLVKITGNSGANLTAGANDTYGVFINGGKTLVSGITLEALGSIIALRSDCELIVTGAAVKTEAYLLMNHGNGASTVTVGENGRVDAKLLRLSDGSGDVNLHGVINLNTGGVIKTAYLFAESNITDGIVYYNDGLLEDHETDFTFANNWVLPYFSNTIVGGANIKVEHSDKIIPAPFFHDPALGGTPDGGLTKLGSKILTINQTCSYNGPTVVSDGTLLLNGIGASKSIVVANGATIGDVSGTLTIPAATTVSPGSSIGTMNVISNLSMSSGSIYDWEVDAGNSADLINVIDVLDLSGAAANSITVNVVAIGVMPEDTNILFSAGGSIIGTSDKIFMSYAVGTSGPANPTINGNNIEVTDIVIPEPVTGLITLFAFAFILRKK